MRARFIGDPRERESGKPLSREPGEWFDVPEGMEDKYRGNSHFETDEAPAKPKRARKSAQPEQSDAWEGDE
jgi:hypothetical protein